jgi:hypothetical protein
MLPGPIYCNVQGAVLMAAPLFSLGRVVATPALLALLAGAGDNPAELLARHQCSDWGVVPPADAKENEFSVRHGFWISSSYAVGRAGERVWIITEADRSSTCILLPEDSL